MHRFTFVRPGRDSRVSIKNSNASRIRSVIRLCVLLPSDHSVGLSRFARRRSDGVGARLGRIRRDDHVRREFSRTHANDATRDLCGNGIRLDRSVSACQQFSLSFHLACCLVSDCYCIAVRMVPMLEVVLHKRLDGFRLDVAFAAAERTGRALWSVRCREKFDVASDCRDDAS